MNSTAIEQYQAIEKFSHSLNNAVTQNHAGDFALLLSLLSENKQFKLSPEKAQTSHIPTYLPTTDFNHAVHNNTTQFQLLKHIAQERQIFSQSYSEIPATTTASTDALETIAASQQQLVG